MTGTGPTSPCLLFALAREAGPFRRRCRPWQTIPGAPGRARWCGPKERRVLALETGMGPARMEAALAWVLARPLLDGTPYRPRMILNAGFAGALQPGHQVGDVFLATEVAEPTGGRWQATWPGKAMLAQGPHPWRQGRLLAVPQALGNPEDKQALGRSHQAEAVDMESATVARLCSQSGVPFGCLRVISDDMATPLSPELSALLAGGTVAPVPVLACMLRHPRLARELWALARQTRQAARQLALGLEALLALAEPGQ